MSDKLIEIYNELYDEGVYLGAGSYDMDGDCDAVVVKANGRHGIFIDIDRVRTYQQELEAVSHEWGHYKTGALYSFDASPVVIAQAEHRATRVQIERIIPRDELAAAVVNGRTEIWELAEMFNISEELMQKAISYYNYGYFKA